LYCVRTAKNIVRILSAHDSPIILVLSELIAVIQNSDLGIDTSNGGDKNRRAVEYRDFRLTVRFISETVHARNVATMND